jgi:hypothetical protein
MENSTSFYSTSGKSSIDAAYNEKVAKEIARQIGGGMFVAMTGATFIVPANYYGVLIRFKGCRKCQWLHIRYNSNDLYDLKFTRINNKTGEEIVHAQFSDIYCDQLQELFEQTTGLYVSL